MRAAGSRRVASALLALASLLGLARAASATYSIVAVDTARREVGGAGTSCLRGSNVYVIYGSVPGTGVVHAQASFSQAGRDRAVELLMQGTAPADIIEEITSGSFDRNAATRQYAVADLSGRVAAFTGSRTQAYAGDRKATPPGFSYSVQGNILTGEAVLTQAATAFESGGCDLAERLMRALEVGAMGGEGDSRCTPDGIPSDSAFLEVDREGEPAGSYLELHVPSSGDDDPLVELRADFDAWRATHPCPAPAAGAGGRGGAGAAGAATGGTGGAGVGGAGSSTLGGAGALGSAGGGAGTTGGRTGGGGGVIDAGSGGMPRGTGATRDEAGCGCRTAPREQGRASAFWGVLVFSLLLTRRWNQSAHRC